MVYPKDLNSETEYGLRCGLVCPECGKKLMAIRENKGAIDERIHYLAHLRSSTCTGFGEGSLHNESMNIVKGSISEHDSFILPNVYVCDFVPHDFLYSHFIELENGKSDLVSKAKNSKQVILPPTSVNIDSAISSYLIEDANFAGKMPFIVLGIDYVDKYGNHIEGNIIVFIDMNNKVGMSSIREVLESDFAVNPRSILGILEIDASDMNPSSESFKDELKKRILGELNENKEQINISSYVNASKNTEEQTKSNSKSSLLKTESSFSLGSYTQKTRKRSHRQSKMNNKPRESKDLLENSLLFIEASDENLSHTLQRELSNKFPDIVVSSQSEIEKQNDILCMLDSFYVKSANQISRNYPYTIVESQTKIFVYLIRKHYTGRENYEQNNIMAYENTIKQMILHLIDGIYRNNIERLEERKQELFDKRNEEIETLKINPMLVPVWVGLINDNNKFEEKYNNSIFDYLRLPQCSQQSQWMRKSTNASSIYDCKECEYHIDSNKVIQLRNFFPIMDKDTGDMKTTNGLCLICDGCSWIENKKLYVFNRTDEQIKRDFEESTTTRNGIRKSRSPFELIEIIKAAIQGKHVFYLVLKRSSCYDFSSTYEYRLDQSKAEIKY